MTRLTQRNLLITLLVIVALLGLYLTEAKAQTNCTTSTFMGTTTTRCSDGSSATSQTFMGQTNTTISPPPGIYIPSYPKPRPRGPLMPWIVSPLADPDDD